MNSKLDDKLKQHGDNMEKKILKILDEMLPPQPNPSILEEDTWKTQNSKLHQEENSNFGLFSYQQCSSNSQGHKPPPLDNNIWNCFSRSGCEQFHGSNPLGRVTQMQHYFFLHGIIVDMTKHKAGVLYLDPKRWQWWEWHKTCYVGYIAWS